MQKKDKNKRIIYLLSASFLAGLFIAFGLTGCVIANIETKSKVVGAAVFPLGLEMVILLKAKLFTGFMSNAISFYQSNKIAKFAILSCIIYLGNLIGSIFFAFFVTKIISVEVSTYIITMAETKISLPISVLIIKGVACNILICAAILISKEKSITDTVISIWALVFLFVLCGFEHSVANMALLSMACILSGGKITILQIIYNLLFVTIGNIIGGIGITVLARFAKDY